MKLQGCLEKNQKFDHNKPTDITENDLNKGIEDEYRCFEFAEGNVKALSNVVLSERFYYS